MPFLIFRLISCLFCMLSALAFAAESATVNEPPAKSLLRKNMLRDADPNASKLIPKAPPPLPPEQLEKFCASDVNNYGEKEFFGASLRARVVEGMMNEPVEGALVFAFWSTNPEAPTKHSELGVVHAIEVLTDKDGYFEIPEWGPKKAVVTVKKFDNWISSVLFNVEKLIRVDPQIVIYKAGYELRVYDPYFGTQRQQNPLPPPIRLRPGERIKSQYDGKVINISRRKTAVPVSYEKAGLVQKVGMPLYYIGQVSPCLADQFPIVMRVVVEIDREWQRGNSSIGQSKAVAICDIPRKKYGCSSITELIDGVAK
jgi:hypothetical protein